MIVSMVSYEKMIFLYGWYFENSYFLKLKQREKI